MTPYYEDDLVTIYHGEAVEVAASLEGALAVVSDPPYGMAWDTNGARFTGGFQGGAPRGRDWGGEIVGDTQPFDPSPWLDYPWVVLFGSNHYGQSLPRGTTLVWLKRNDDAFGTFLSDAEIAWRKGGHGVYAYRSLRPLGPTLHPTQKPVDLMRWCIAKSGAPDGTTILDPFMGSGSTLVAAKSLNRFSIGIEIEERYCEIAANRCRQEVLGLSA